MKKLKDKILVFNYNPKEQSYFFLKTNKKNKIDYNHFYKINKDELELKYKKCKFLDFNHFNFNELEKIYGTIAKKLEQNPLKIKYFLIFLLQNKIVKKEINLDNPENLENPLIELNDLKLEIWKKVLRLSNLKITIDGIIKKEGFVV